MAGVRQPRFGQQQITSLAAAMPQEAYGWRPSEGVRSVGEVYLHIAFGNTWASRSPTHA